MSIFERILQLLYPGRCAFCHKFTDDGAIICKSCPDKLPYTEFDAVRQELSPKFFCYSPLYYEGMVRESVLRFKFNGATGYSEIYGKLLAKCIDENGVFCDIITWVPLSRRRYRSRGYNQTELIAKEISRINGIPCVSLLKKTRHNKAQSGTGDLAKRRENVKGVYAPLSPGLIKGKRILLVDDVVTTGSTLRECAAVLSKCGAAGVTALALARKRN